MKRKDSQTSKRDTKDFNVADAAHMQVANIVVDAKKQNEKAIAVAARSNVDDSASVCKELFLVFFLSH